MAVWAVRTMAVDWFADGDEYLMRFTARDGSEIAISVAGSTFDAHAAAVGAAVARRRTSHASVVPIAPAAG